MDKRTWPLTPEEKRRKYLRVMGLPLDATAMDIRAMYRCLARQFHPDKNLDSIKASTVRFQRLQEANLYLTEGVSGDPNRTP